MDKALQTMIDNMPEKTGKKLEEWFQILEKEKFEKHSAAVKFLKTEHGVTHGFANTITSLFLKKDQPEKDLVSTQYEGKESLKPIYNMLISIVEKFGNDIKITPKKYL